MWVFFKAPRSLTELPWGTGLLPSCPLGPMPGVRGERKLPHAAEHWARCRPSLLPAGSTAFRLVLLLQGPRVGAETFWVSRASLGPGREQWAGQPAGPGGLGASAVGLEKVQVLLPSRPARVAPAGRGERQKCKACSGWVSSPHLSSNCQHPAVKTMMGSLIVHFLDLELHLHLLSRIKSSPCPVFLPGFSPPQ